MKAYCINLKTSMDRKEKMEAQFKRENIEVEFIEAVDAKTLPKHPWITVGDYANGLSHQKIWKDIVENNREISLVFEDQCIIAEQFLEKVSEIKLPDRWDIIYLGHDVPRYFSYENEHLDLGKPTSTYCYLISLTGAKKLVNFQPEDYWIIPDTQFSFMPLRTFYMRNRLARRDPSSKSIIGANPIKRKILHPLVLYHLLAHFFICYPVLEVVFCLVILFLLYNCR